MQNLFQSGAPVEGKTSEGSVTSTATQDSATIGANMLSVALIGPDPQRRQAVAQVLDGQQVATTREFSVYPELDDVPKLLQQDFDVVIVDLDGNPEHALDLVESLCVNSSITVMVYSAHTDAELLVRCMRVGAREYLTEPFAPGAVAEALVRAAVRRPAIRTVRKGAGKLVVFVGAKGGSGVTTIATNYALSLARESGKGTVLIDFDSPLGDTALHLGISTQYSTAMALQNAERLDSNFLSTLLSKHSSGLQLLAAPDRYVPFHVTPEALGRLIAVSRQSFDFVVVDAGSTLGPHLRALFDEAAIVYLVTQVGIPELRNANRFITEYFKGHNGKLQIVLNRFAPHTIGVDEVNVTKALTKPADWKIPGDYPAVRKAQNTATPLALQDSPIARVIRQMARQACDLPPVAQKKGFSLFRSKAAHSNGV